ncbi:hypothetical protein CAEBREN_11054 [Caenorhabditis brenneri]|uniref:DUF38 domain-containing protein n=1 Tax=Caenorhabditis brenneri TaxID=135651 RepID=G0PKD4_CAEBE|nr:hypothetical protein CAEBREN_11054 [Caenorhabditis brenneri]
MCLRKVCHTLRSYIDQNLPEANFQNINIHLEDDHVILHYQLHGCEENVVRYYMRDDGCHLVHDNKYLCLEGTSHKELFFEDFKCILKFQRSSNLHGFLILGRDIYDEDVYQEFLASVGTILENSGRILKSSEIRIDAPKQNLMLQFLPHFDAQVLKKVHFEPRERLEMNRIVELAQWKNLDHVVLRNVVINPGIEHFLHLKRATLNFDTISGEELKRVKETLISTPSMGPFYIGHQNYGASYEFGHLVGDPVIFERYDEKRWFFNIPGDNDKLLYVFTDDDAYDMQFTFEKTPKTHISEGVEIYD